MFNDSLPPPSDRSNLDMPQIGDTVVVGGILGTIFRRYWPRPPVGDVGPAHPVFNVHTRDGKDIAIPESGIQTVFRGRYR